MTKKIVVYLGEEDVDQSRAVSNSDEDIEVYVVAVARDISDLGSKKMVVINPEIEKDEEEVNKFEMFVNRNRAVDNYRMN